MRSTFLPLAFIIVLGFVYSSACSLPLFTARPYGTNIAAIIFKYDDNDSSTLKIKNDLLNNDTLHFVVTDSFLNYPFGAHAGIKNFRQAYPQTFVQSQKHSITPYKENSAKKEKVYYLAAVKNSKPSSIAIYNNKYTGKCELVMSLILTDQIALENGILIGMGKDEFLKKFIDATSTGAATGNIVWLQSTNKQTDHYYRFIDNKLVEIKMFTNHFYTVK